jgi:uncharacterized RDD family membrane protein YckC
MSNASLLRRLSAFGLDYLVILGYVAVLSAAIWGLSRLPAVYSALGELFSQPNLFDLFAFLTLVFPVLLYFALMEGSRRGATLGKGWLGLRVTSVDGGGLGYRRSLLRSAIKFLPWQIAHTSLFHIPGWPTQVESIPPASIAGFALVWVLVLLYLGCQIIRRDHRTLYDLLSGAAVTYQPRKIMAKALSQESS